MLDIRNAIRKTTFNTGLYFRMAAYATYDGPSSYTVATLRIPNVKLFIGLDPSKVRLKDAGFSTYDKGRLIRNTPEILGPTWCFVKFRNIHTAQH
jgi:hypothetical protein